MSKPSGLTMNVEFEFEWWFKALFKALANTCRVLMNLNLLSAETTSKVLHGLINKGVKVKIDAGKIGKIGWMRLGEMQNH